jgi:hypothetical protein
MVKIRPYTDNDYREMVSWFNLRQLPSPKASHLPKVGYFAPGAAAGFLYMTDSAVCLLDTFIANPDCENAKRDSAINLIAAHLINAARSHGFETIICSSGSYSIKSRAEKLGFKKLGQETVFAKEL